MFSATLPFADASNRSDQKGFPPPIYQVNFGAPLEYDENWVGRYYVQETTLLGISFLPSIAYKFTDNPNMRKYLVSQRYI